MAECGESGDMWPCFLGSGVQVGGSGVADAVRVDVERGRMVGVEPIEESH
jgi:hypothetical protein